MFFFTFVAGLVALIADEQFGGQHTIGWVLLAVTVGLLLLQLLVVLGIGIFTAKNTPRTRRGF
jgi:hypothetical protein